MDPTHRQCIRWIKRRNNIRFIRACLKYDLISQKPARISKQDCNDWISFNMTHNPITSLPIEYGSKDYHKFKRACKRHKIDIPDKLTIKDEFELLEEDKKQEFIDNCDSAELIELGITDDTIAISIGLKSFYEYAACEYNVYLSEGVLFGLFNVNINRAYKSDEFPSDLKDECVTVELWSGNIQGWNKIKPLKGGLDITLVGKPFVSSNEGPKRHIDEDDDYYWSATLCTRGFKIKRSSAERFSWDYMYYRRLGYQNDTPVKGSWKVPNEFWDGPYFFMFNKVPSSNVEKKLVNSRVIKMKDYSPNNTITVNFYILYDNNEFIGYAMNQPEFRAFDPFGGFKSDDGYYYFYLLWYKYLKQKDNKIKGFCITGFQSEYCINEYKEDLQLPSDYLDYRNVSFKEHIFS